MVEGSHRKDTMDGEMKRRGGGLESGGDMGRASPRITLERRYFQFKLMALSPQIPNAFWFYF